MTVSLSPQEAEDKIHQIESARDQAVAKLASIEDAQEQMLSKNWQGGSAHDYQLAAQGQHDEFQDIINALNDTVAKGSEHLRAVAARDNG